VTNPVIRGRFGDSVEQIRVLRDLRLSQKYVRSIPFYFTSFIAPILFRVSQKLFVRCSSYFKDALNLNIMKSLRCIQIFAIFALVICSVKAQDGLPAIKSNSSKITIQDGDVRKKDWWNLARYPV